MEEDAPFCRVCHGEEESERPLFCPCKCSGSIKYIHADCLRQWIASKPANENSKPACELCRTTFTFERKYAPGAPKHLGPIELFSALVGLVREKIPLLWGFLVLPAIWLLVVPIILSWWTDCLHSTLHTDLVATWHPMEWLAERNFSMTLLTFDLFYGALIIVAVWGLFDEMSDMIHRMNHFVELVRTQEEAEDIANQRARETTAQEEAARAQEEENNVNNTIDDDDDVPEPPFIDVPEAQANADVGEAAAEGIAEMEIAEVIEDRAEAIRAHVRVVDAHERDEQQEGAVHGLGHGHVDHQGGDGGADGVDPVGHAANIWIRQARLGRNNEQRRQRIIHGLPGRMNARAIARHLLSIMMAVTFLQAVCIPLGRWCMGTLTEEDNKIFTGDVVNYLKHLEMSDESSAAAAPQGSEGLLLFDGGSAVLLADFVITFAHGFLGLMVLVLTLIPVWIIMKLGSLSCGRLLRFGTAAARVGLQASRSALRHVQLTSIFMYDHVILPGTIGFLIDLFSLKAMGTTLDARLKHLYTSPLIPVAHMALGFCFHLNFDAVIVETKRFLDDRSLHYPSLETLLPSREEPELLLARRSLSSIVMRMLILSALSLTAVIATVLVPLHFGHHLCPFGQGPLQFYADDTALELQLPLEMLLFHFVVPMVLEGVNHKRIVSAVVYGYGALTCALFGLDQLSENEEDLSEQDEAGREGRGTRTGQAVRVVTRDGTSIGSYFVGGVTAIGAHAYAAVVCSWVLHAPLLLGRRLVGLVHDHFHHDLHAFSLGALTLSLLVRAGYHMLRSAEQLHVTNIVRAVVSAVSLCAKVLVLSTVWIGILPLMVGYLIDAAVIIPIRVSAGETHRYPIVRSWALGLILFHLWSRCHLLGVFGDTMWRQRLQRVVNQGLFRMDATYIGTEIFLPLFVRLGDHLFVPYFLARTMSLLQPSYIFRTFLVRHCYIVYLTLRLIIALVSVVYEQFIRLHDNIRDQRYLVSVEVTNRSE